MKAYPQYASTSDGSSSSEDPVNQDFQTLANAIDQNDVDGAKNAWSKVKSDLSNDGLLSIQNPADTITEALAENQANLDQTLINDLSGRSSDANSSLATLLGNSSDGTTGSSDSVSALVSNWIAYQSNGTASASAPVSLTGGQLDASA